MLTLCLLNSFVIVAQISPAPVELVLFDPSANRCGPNALMVCFEAMQHPVADETLLKFFPYSGKDSSLAELKAAAEEIGVLSRPVCWRHGPPPFDFGFAPAVVPVRNSNTNLHFVAMLACDGESVTIIDYPHQPRQIRVTEFRQKSGWDGTALHLATHQERLDRLLPNNHSWTRWGLWVALAICLGGCLVSSVGLSKTRIMRAASRC